MNIELIPGLSNVIRFPIEDRVEPSMDLLNQIGPRPDEVAAVAESFHLDEGDPDLQDATDRETALHIAEQILPLGLDADALKQRLSFQLSLVAMLRETTRPPVCVDRLSGSRPRLPISSTLFRKPLMISFLISPRGGFGSCRCVPLGAVVENRPVRPVRSVGM